MSTDNPWSKGRKPHQERWKEKSIKGMRAVADLSSLLPVLGQQGCIGLKKTLELHDASGQRHHQQVARLRVHPALPVLPDDDASKLMPAVRNTQLGYWYLCPHKNE